MINLFREAYKTIFNYETRLWLYKLRHPAKYKRLRSVLNPSEKGNFSLKPYDEYRCIFIHITKTAGTSVAKGLFNYLPYHYTGIDYRVIYGRKTFSRYFKFAFVRNPWDRLYSAYRYLKSGGWNQEDERWYRENLSNFDDFNDFVQHWLNLKNIQSHIHFRPQHHFICDNKDRILVNYLAYFETLENDFNTIAQHLNIDSTLRHHNASPSNSYIKVYNDASKKIVADVYAKDITLFGYSFEGIKQRRMLSDL
jgi:hypothetical protein